MSKFILGIVVTLVVMAIGFFCYTRLGFAPIAADENAGSMEAFLLGGALDPSVERHAQHTAFPIDVNTENLTTGMKLYVMNCAVCHGEMDKKPSPIGTSMYPKAPQFIQRNRGLHDPGWFTFYEIQHGIRRTGMPAFGKLLGDDDIWKVTAFLENIGKLPEAVLQQVPGAGMAAEPPAEAPAPKPKRK